MPIVRLVGGSRRRGHRPPPVWGGGGATRLGAIEEARAELGDLFVLRWGRGEQTVVCHPDPAREVLVRKADRFAKQPPGTQRRGLGLLLAEGLLTCSAADRWRTHRRLLDPVFGRSAVSGLAAPLDAACERLLGRWQALGDGALVDVFAAMRALVGEVVMRLVFGPGANSLPPELLLPLSLATARTSRVAEARQRAVAWVEARLGEGVEGGTLLQVLVQARDSRGSCLFSEREVVDEVLTAFAAGVDTGAAALAWAWHCLAGRSEVWERLAAEAGNAEEPGENALLAAVVFETLRLYPPIPGIPRVALADTVLGGYLVPAGTRILVSIYAIQRHPSLWPQAALFRPERFLGVRPAGGRGFLAFGLGERACIGRQLALLLMGRVLARLAPALRFEPSHGVEPAVAVGLLPRGGLPLRLRLAR